MTAGCRPSAGPAALPALAQSSAMYKHSRLAKQEQAQQAPRRSKSQPSFGGHVRPGISATLHSFMSANTARPVERRGKQVTSGQPQKPKKDKLERAMTSSVATSNSSSPAPFGAACPSVSPSETRFNPFSSSSSNLTINSMDSQSCTYDEEGVLMTAGADALWKKLLPTQEYSPPRELVFTLLLNLRAFVSPQEMLQKLTQSCIFEQHSNIANFSRSRRSRLFEHVYDFLEEWITNIPYDFRPAEMRERVTELFGLWTADPAIKSQVNDLLSNLNKVLAKRDHYEKALQGLRLNHDLNVEKAVEMAGLAATGASPAVVAQQLAHIELERLGMIGADEVVQMLSSNSLESLGQSDREVCGNIRYYIDWFNQLTAVTATEVMRHARKRHRVKCIEFFIDLGKECMNIGNFNSLMAIVAGLSVQAISRLKRTWSRVDKAKLEILQQQLNPSGNFVSYRATLNAAIWRFEGATQESERVIVPFFGLLLKDLYLIHHACLDPLPNGQLKIGMFAQFAQHISNLIKWKSRPCPFKRNQQILQYLLLAGSYSDKSLLLLSYEYELPETQADRDQHKELNDSKSE